MFFFYIQTVVEKTRNISANNDFNRSFLNDFLTRNNQIILQNTIIGNKIKTFSEVIYRKNLFFSLITYMIIGIKNTCNLLSVDIGYWDVDKDIVGDIKEEVKIRIIDK